MGVVVGGEALFLGADGYRRKPLSNLFIWRVG
jgi:hypothetical protein